MNEYIYVFLICILLLFVLMGIASISERRHHHDEDSNFRNSEGDHRYYERSLIEKKNFMRNHPEIPDDDLRSISRLLRRLRLKKK